MSASKLILRLHQHRLWVNQRVREAVQGLSDQQLQQRLAIGQGSVWKTLTHLLAAEYVWLEALLGNQSPVFPGDLPDQLPGNQQGPEALSSLSQLTGCWLNTEARWRRYLERLTDADLADPVYKISTSSQAGKRHGIARSDILLHVCTHAQYTTAQLVNMLRQLHVSPLPDVMLITLARQEAASSAPGPQ